MDLKEALALTPRTKPLDSQEEFQGNDFTSGVERGGLGLRSAAYGAAAGLSGNEDLAAEADYYGNRAARTPRQFESFRDVNPLNPLDWIDYGQQVAGEQVPNLVTMAATGGVPGALAKSALAARVGAGAASAGMQFGGMANELRDVGKSPDLLTGGLAILGGAADVFGLETLGKGMLQSAIGELVKSDAKTTAAKRVLSGAWQGFKEGVKSELPAELLQEDLAIINRAAKDPAYLKDTKDISNRLLETGVQTAAFAGPAGAAPAGYGAAKNRPTPPPSDSQTHDMSLDDLSRLSPDSSTLQGATHGEETRQESTDALPSGKRQEVLNGTGASAPVSSNAAYALNFFQQKGLSREDASALVGNLMAESGPGLDPNATNPSSGAYGIAQHLGDRKDKLLAKGGQGNLDVQLNHVWDELTTTHKRALDTMLQGKTVEDKTLAIRKLYEIPGESEARDQERFNFARRLAGLPEDIPANSGTLASGLGKHIGSSVYSDQMEQDQTGQSVADEGDDWASTDEGFTLTQKGQKHESSGDDLWKPGREVHNQDRDAMEGVTSHDTAWRAFQQIYPGATQTITRDNYDSRRINVALPKTEETDAEDAHSMQDRNVAAATLRAFHSGKEAGQDKKIPLQHPDIISKNTGAPIETPVTKNALVELGKALNPELRDNTAQSAHQAAVTGLAHLVYDKGFVPQDLDINDSETGKKAFESWIETYLGKPETDNTPVRASERPMGLVKQGLPITHLMSDSGTSVGRETANRLNIPHRVSSPASKMQPTSRIVFEGEGSTPATTGDVPELRIPEGTNPKTAAYHVQEFLREKGGERPHITATTKEHGAVLRKALMPGKLPQGETIGSPDANEDFFTPKGDLAPPDGLMHETPEPQQVSTARSKDPALRGETQGAVDLAEQATKASRGSFEQTHEVPGGGTIHASGVPGKVVKFLSTALGHIGIKVPLRVMGRTAIAQHIDALGQELERTTTALKTAQDKLSDLNAFTNRKAKNAKKEEVKALKGEVLFHEQRLADIQTEINNLKQAQAETFAARIIYNDHYTHVSDRTPIVIVSDEALASPNLGKVLAHELGHLVQRAWFDQIEPELKVAIINELCPNGYDPDEFAEAFADRFMEWYQIHRKTAGHQARKNAPIEDIRAAKARADRRLEKVGRRADLGSVKGLDALFKFYGLMAKSLEKLWANLKKQDAEFRKEYPKFDEFMRSTIGVYGTLKPINNAEVVAWRSEVSNPQLGLPVRVYDTAQFRNMTIDEVTDAAGKAIDLGKKRAADWASGVPALQSKTAQAYLRSLKAIYKTVARKAEEWAVAEGERLRGSWSGLFEDWADIYAPRAGVERREVRALEVKFKDGTTLGTMKMKVPLANMTKMMLAKHFAPKLQPLLVRISELSPDEMTALWENLRDQSLPAATDLALDIRKYLASMYGTLTDAYHMDLGKMTNYFTKTWDLDKFADPGLKDEIIQKFTEVFKNREELPVRARTKQVTQHPDGTETWGYKEVRFETPEAAAIQMYLDISEGRVDLFQEKSEEAIREDLRSSAFPYARPRPFDESEYRDFGLYDYLNQDVANILATYTNAAAKRIAQSYATGIPHSQRSGMAGRYWINRFVSAGLDSQVMNSPTAALDLLLAEGIKYGQIPREDAERARNLLMSSLGMKNIGTDPQMRKVVNNVLAWQTVTTMLFSGFMQLSDFGITAWRSENMDRAFNGMRSLFNGLEFEKQKGLLYDVGLAMDELSRGALQAESGLTGDPLGKAAHTLTEKFFHLNQMHRLSEYGLIYASVLGQSYIKDYSQQALFGETRELRDAARKKLNALYPDFDPNEGIKGDFRGNLMLGYALQAFVDQAHLHNQQGYTPEIFQDYRFKIFTQLKGFMFKYHNIILKQVWQKMKDEPDLLRATLPLVTLVAATVPLAMLGMEAKDVVRRQLLEAAGLKVKRPPKPKTVAEHLYEGVMAAGVPGVYLSMFDQMSEAKQHGQPGIIAVMGPTIGTVYNISTRTADEWMPGLIPGVANVPWARAKAREFMRDLGFGVRDEEE